MYGMEIKQTHIFSKWFNRLDNVAAAVVYARLLHVERGTFGQWRSVGKGVSELKIDYVPGIAFISLAGVGNSSFSWSVATNANNPKTFAWRRVWQSSQLKAVLIFWRATDVKHIKSQKNDC